MGATSGISGGAAAQWYRVQAVSRGCLGGTADRDYASVLPAVLNAARHRRPLVVVVAANADVLLDHLVALALRVAQQRTRPDRNGLPIDVMQGEERESV